MDEDEIVQYVVNITWSNRPAIGRARTAARLLWVARGLALVILLALIAILCLNLIGAALLGMAKFVRSHRGTTQGFRVESYFDYV